MDDMDRLFREPYVVIPLDETASPAPRFDAELKGRRQKIHRRVELWLAEHFPNARPRHWRLALRVSVAVLCSALLLLALRYIVDHMQARHIAQRGQTTVVRGAPVINVLEPTSVLSTPSELNGLRERLPLSPLPESSIERGHFVQLDVHGRLVNMTTDGLRALAAQYVQTTCPQCACVSWAHFGVARKAVFVPASALAAQRSTLGAAAALGHATLAADRHGDGGVMLYNGEVLSQDDSVQTDTRQHCALRQLAETGDAPWRTSNASALIQYVSHDGLKSRARIYLPAWACVESNFDALLRTSLGS